MSASVPSAPALTIAGAAIHPLVVAGDARGWLSAGEIGAQLPFAPLRYFAISRVPPGATRGAHAHWELDQFVVCLHGSLNVILDDGRGRQTIRLDGPSFGIHVSPLTWVALEDFAEGTVVLVLASAVYDEADYIRDYSDFLEAVRR